MSIRSRTNSLESLHALEEQSRMNALRVRYFHVLYTYHESLISLFRGLPELEWQDIWRTVYTRCIDQIDTIVKTRMIYVNPAGEAMSKLTVYWLQSPYGRGWKTLRNIENFHDVAIDMTSLSI